jgi:hypothetical protein
MTLNYNLKAIMIVVHYISKLIASETNVFVTIIDKILTVIDMGLVQIFLRL